MSTADEREIRRKLKVLRHAEQSGNTGKDLPVFWGKPLYILSMATPV